MYYSETFSAPIESEADARIYFQAYLSATVYDYDTVIELVAQLTPEELRAYKYYYFCVLSTMKKYKLTSHAQVVAEALDNFTI